MNGTLVRLPSNPPTHAAWGFCACSPHCDRFLWASDVVLRDMRGEHHNVICAIRQGDLSHEEMQGCNPGDLPEAVIRTQEEKPKRRRQRK